MCLSYIFVYYITFRFISYQYHLTMYTYIISKNICVVFHLPKVFLGVWDSKEALLLNPSPLSAPTPMTERALLFMATRLTAVCAC